MPDIIVINESTVVSDEDLATWTAAVQRQITEHVAPFWGVSATLHNLPSGSPRPTGDEWWMVVLDDELSTINLGYHELGSNGQPMGKVLAKKELDSPWNSPGLTRESPSRVLSHEIIEMLVDPNLVSTIDYDDMSYQVEPGDIVMLPTQGYPIDNVLVSGWATPAYYRLNTDTRYDYGGYLTGPCPTQAHGTYLLQRKIGEQTWQPNVLYALAEGPGLEPQRLHYMTRPHLGSRRHRIALGHAKWIRSTADVPGR